jgi:hypothetical protein
MFDLAMLAFQCGEYQLAEVMFQQLRRGRRYQDVPPERACFWSISAHSRKARTVLLLITSISSTELDGWGCIVDPTTWRGTIKFMVRDFRSRLGTQAVQEGHTVRGRVRLERSGPLMFPGEE